MHYEMFLIIQLVHLTCRKDRVQSSTKKGQDLFRRTSDDSSRFTLIIQNEEWCLGCSIKTWREVCNVFHIQGKICSTRILMERMHRLWRDICSHWKLRHTIGRIMCENETRPCMSSKDTHRITHAWGAWRSPRVMKILTFATRLKMKSCRGWQAHRWVQQQIFQDRGSWYPVTLNGYIEY